MKRGLVLVEGQTEERFVNECLGPYFATHGLFLIATVVKTKRVVGAAHFEGGVTSYGQVRRDLGCCCAIPMRRSSPRCSTTTLSLRTFRECTTVHPVLPSNALCMSRRPGLPPSKIAGSSRT